MVADAGQRPEPGTPASSDNFIHRCVLALYLFLFSCRYEHQRDYNPRQANISLTALYRRLAITETRPSHAMRALERALHAVNRHLAPLADALNKAVLPTGFTVEVKGDHVRFLAKGEAIEHEREINEIKKSVIETDRGPMLREVAERAVYDDDEPAREVDSDEAVTEIEATTNEQDDDEAEAERRMLREKEQRYAARDRIQTEQDRVKADHTIPYDPRYPPRTIPYDPRYPPRTIPYDPMKTPSCSWGRGTTRVFPSPSKRKKIFKRKEESLRRSALVDAVKSRAASAAMDLRKLGIFRWQLYQKV
jgi:hypothetical protein